MKRRSAEECIATTAENRIKKQQKTSKIQFSKNPLTAVFCPNCFNLFNLHFVKKQRECVNVAIALELL
ncbi:hypothetical protein ACROYT_G028308 [Oculina patagonica]